jgi:PAS domain S-box-containing protein
MATIIASSSDAIISKTLDGRILTWNKGAEKILGYTFDEIKGKHISILFPTRLLSEEEMLLSKILNGENVEQYETVRVKKDKVKIDVSITLSAIKNTHGQIVGISKILRDITLHKKAEKESKLLLELTTRQNERLKNFAHIVSHNLRSHSGNIGMLLNMYLQKTPDTAGNKILQHIKIASDSLNETIENLNEVVLMNTGIEQNLVPVHLDAAIKSAIINISQLITDAGANITNNVDKDVTVMGLPAYIDSILLNFLTNAIKYRSPDRESTVVLSTAFQSNFVVLSIEDNGLGIDIKKNGDKLFGMYKTFHGNKDARGIGLFITKNQIEAIGATVAVESEVDKGTVFKIYFKHE